MTTKVIYHRSDYDGIFCREIARKFLPDAELIGWEYGDEAPSVSPEEQLYMLDISVDALMKHPNLVWIDHHKTAMEKYSPKIQGYRIDGVAACRLAWAFFTSLQKWKGTPEFNNYLPSKEDFIEREVIEPEAVRLAGEYDIWDKRDPRAEVFQYGLRTITLADADWKKLVSVDSVESKGFVEWLLDRASVAQAYAKHIDESLMKSRAFEMKWEGVYFLCVNTGRFNSQTFASAVKPEHDALLGFAWDGKKWVVSMYGVPHQPDLDLSAIAIKHGGGGHKQACGFTCDELPFRLVTYMIHMKEQSDG